MKPKGKRTFFDSVKDCLNGINYTIHHEKNFIREAVIGIIALIAGVILKISLIEWIVVLLLICLVLVLEMINTAFENTIDLITDKYHDLAKAVKDIAAGSVLIVSFFAGIIGMLIFIPKIIALL